MSGRKKRKVSLTEQVKTTMMEVEGSKENLSNLMDGLKSIVQFKDEKNNDIPEEIFEQIKQISSVVEQDYNVYKEAMDQCDKNYAILKGVSAGVRTRGAYEDLVSNSCSISQQYLNITFPVMQSLTDGSNQIAKVLSKVDESFNEYIVDESSLLNTEEEIKEEIAVDINVEEIQEAIEEAQITEVEETKEEA